MQRWERWAESAGLAAADPATVNNTTRVLHRCGQAWRAVLSGEKMATDLLEVSDYVTAARGTLARAAEIARALALRLWMPLAVAGVLIGIGIWLIIANHSTAQVLAGLRRRPGHHMAQRGWVARALRTANSSAVASTPAQPVPSQPDPALANSSVTESDTGPVTTS